VRRLAASIRMPIGCLGDRTPPWSIRETRGARWRRFGVRRRDVHQGL